MSQQSDRNNANEQQRIELSNQNRDTLKKTINHGSLQDVLLSLQSICAEAHIANSDELWRSDFECLNSIIPFIKN